MPKILLVEDNEVNRDMLVRRLERKGFEVMVAVNGAESVAKAQSDQPDLILMDMHLPVLDGWTATQQLKADPQTCAIPVIALTADALAGEREKALAAGCDDYDTKPIDLPRLLEKIDRLLKPTTAPPQLDTPNLPADQHQQRRLLTRLQQALERPIYNIIGYSDLLLDIVSDQQNASLRRDLQKIYQAGKQLLQLLRAILNPVLVEVQRQEIDLCSAALRREILTPLSTVKGYCEMVLEEATADLIPDLEQIQTSAQNLLSMITHLERLIQQQTQSAALEPDHPDAEAQMLERLAAKVLAQYKAEIQRSPTTQAPHILLIDSHEANCPLLSRQLQRLNGQVAIATTHQQAIQSLETTFYHLILLDISPSDHAKANDEVNPEFALLEQIKSHEKWQHMPILLIATMDQMEYVALGIAMGATDYLTKPVQSVLLQSKIAACLQRNQNRNFDSLFDHAPIGIYRTVGAESFCEANPALVKLLGYPDAATLIETVTNIATQIYVDPDRYREFSTALEAQDQVIGFEYQAYRYDGDLIWVLQHAYAVRDPQGQLLYYEGMVEEITQRKLNEISLLQQLTELHELEQVKHSQQAESIVQTDYFQQLHSEADSRVVQESDRPVNLPLKILLVEDNELNRDMLSRRLKRVGYEVIIATDGAEGVAKAKAELPQVILMDISLPVMDGWDATQQLKGNPSTSNIPVIALTAHAMTGDREKSLAAGCDDYDTKPIDLPRLLGKIEECLNRR